MDLPLKNVKLNIQEINVNKEDTKYILPARMDTKLSVRDGVDHNVLKDLEVY